MTIGIGVLCDEGRCAIAASDMRASYPKTAVDPNDYVGKQYSFPGVSGFENVTCSIAGRLGVTHDVVSQMTVEFKRLARKNKVYREDIQNAIDKARAHELRRRMDWALKVNLGVTVSQVLRGRLPSGPLDPVALAECRNIMSSVPFIVEVLVIGFKGTEPFLFKGSEKHDLESESAPGIYVIGSKGKVAALDHLNKRGQNLHFGFARTVLHIHEALEIARKDDPKHIGRASFYSVMLAGDTKTCRFPPYSPLVRGWASAYKDRADTVSLEKEIPNNQARALLCGWEGHQGR